MMMDFKCSSRNQCGFKVNRKGLPICTSGVVCGQQVEVPYCPSNSKSQRYIGAFKGLNSDFKRYLQRTPLVIMEGEINVYS